jgi:hypothetical protein
MAASVSSRWCLVFSATAAGSGRRKAPAMYAERRCISGETGGADRMSGSARYHGRTDRLAAIVCGAALAVAPSAGARAD